MGLVGRAGVEVSVVDGAGDGVAVRASVGITSVPGVDTGIDSDTAGLAAGADCHGNFRLFFGGC